MHVRPATAADLPRVLDLVKQMFRDLGPTITSTNWETAAHARLTHGDGVRTFVAVDAEDRPIAIAVGVVDKHLPSPRQPSGIVGSVEWLATSERHRRRGAARAAMNALLKWFDDQGITTVDVHASAAARQLYEELDFRTPRAAPLRRVTSRLA